MRNIVEVRASAAITWLGGLGKTQLMAAFAQGAERDENSPRIVYWITADGEASDVVKSLALLAEHLTGWEIPTKDRVKPEIVLAALRNPLTKANRH